MPVKPCQRLSSTLLCTGTKCDFLGAILPGLSFTGILNTQLNVKGEDFSLEALEDKLETEGAMTMTDGLLRDMNLFREVVTRIGVIPDLQQKLLDSLPPSYQDKLKLNDTPFPQIELAVTGEGLSLDFNKALIQSEDFMLEGSGRYGWPDDLVVRRGTALVLGEEFSPPSAPRHKGLDRTPRRHPDSSRRRSNPIRRSKRTEHNRIRTSRSPGVCIR